MKSPDFSAVLAKAHAAASAASAAHVAAHGEAMFNCGFAWVLIDGMSPLARYCRKQAKNSNDCNLGDKGHPRGWQFWGPGNYFGQDMSAKQAGANAFQKVLAEELEMVASVGSRLD
jgi:hypothetical protein